MAGRSNGDFAISRYHPNGTLDNSFDFDGKLLVDLGTTGDSAQAVAVTPDRKIIAGGHTTSDFALARINEDGTPDTSFGDGGEVLTNFGSAETRKGDIHLCS